MRIVTYDEVDPRAVRQLCVTAAGWDVHEDHIRKIRRVDPRCFDGFALYAVEDGKVVTQVIPFRMRVRLLSGEETVVRSRVSVPTQHGGARDSRGTPCNGPTNGSSARDCGSRPSRRVETSAGIGSTRRWGT